MVGDHDLCDGPLRPCLKSWMFSLIVVPVNNICWFHQILFPDNWDILLPIISIFLVTIPNEMSFLPTYLTSYLIIIENVDWAPSWSHVGRSRVWYPIFALIEWPVMYWNVVWRGVQRRFMIVEGLSMGFAFNVREKGGSLTSGWSRHGIWTPLCGLLLKVCDVKFHKVSFNLMFKIV